MSQRQQQLLLLAIILLGALFRFGELAHVRHGYDEGYQAYDALRMLEGDAFPLRIGQPSSVFLDNPPLMPYIQAIPLLLWRSLWSVYIFITALNTLAIWFVYQTTRQTLGTTAAFLAALLFAISPWVVHFSRTPWTQGLLPFFTAVIAWGLWPTLVNSPDNTHHSEQSILFDKRGESLKPNAAPNQPSEEAPSTDSSLRASAPLREALFSASHRSTGQNKTPPPWHFLIGAIAAIAMMQTYIVAFGVLLPLALLGLFFWRRLPKRPFFLGTALFILSLITFALGLGTGTERNSSKFQEFLLEQRFSFTSEAWSHGVRYVTGLTFDGEESLAASWYTGMNVAHLLLGAALLLGLVQAIIALRQNGRYRRLALVLLIWFLSPIAALSFLPTLVHPHYLMLTLPAGQLLAAWGLLPLWQRPASRWATIVVLAAITLLFRFNLIAVGQAVATNPNGYGFNGWPLGDIAPVGHAVRQLSEGNSAPRRLYAADHEALLSGISGTYVDTMSELDIDRFVMLPGQEPMLYLLLSNPDNATLLPQPAIASQTLPLSDDTAVSLLQIPPYTQAEAEALPQTAVNWTSDAGLTLLGYTFITPPPLAMGQNSELLIYWRVAELHPDRGGWFVQSFYQLLNPEWQLVTNIEGNGQWGHRWQRGDVYIERITLPIPSDLPATDYRLLIGLFDPIQEQNFYLNAPTSREYGHTIPLTLSLSP